LKSWSDPEKNYGLSFNQANSSSYPDTFEVQRYGGSPAGDRRSTSDQDSTVSSRFACQMMTGFPTMAAAIADQRHRSGEIPGLRLLRPSPLGENALNQCDGL
jgi:hypothetical protein